MDVRLISADRVDLGITGRAALSASPVTITQSMQDAGDCGDGHCAILLTHASRMPLLLDWMLLPLLTPSVLSPGGLCAVQGWPGTYPQHRLRCAGHAYM